jgi:hypothetical protein
MVTDDVPVEAVERTGPQAQNALAPGAIPPTSPDKEKARWRLAWLLVPALAVVAFAPAITLWFVSDDFGHLFYRQALPFPQPFLYIPGGQMFYRPLSISIIWELGYALFGTNSLPYHIVSVTLHALAAYLLARAVTTITGQARTGWIAGALFAVHPLAVEPVAWLAAQWDIWAAVCALAAVWGFATAWKKRDWKPYVAGLVAATLGVFMKESILPLPVVMPFVALATELNSSYRVPSASVEWKALARRAIVWSLPFALPTLLFAGLRVANGGIGGYPNAATDFQNFFWDALITSGLLMVAPLNRDVFDPVVAQAVGLLTATVLLVGITLWGRRRWPVLLLSFVWWLAFLIPVLNLIPKNISDTGSRVFYLSLAAFCIVLAVILSEWLGRLPARRVAQAVLIAALTLGIPATWLQLQPWVQTSNQAKHIVAELGRLIAPMPRQRLQLNVQDMPYQYKGSYLFLNDLDAAVAIFNHQPAVVTEVPKLDSRRLVEPFDINSGVYNIAFSLDTRDQLFYVSGISGSTIPRDPSAGETQVWDFRACGKDQMSALQASQGSFECSGIPSDSYATFSPTTQDGSLQIPGLSVNLQGSRWLRLAVCARLPAKLDGRIGEWFWQADGQQSFDQERSHAFPLSPAGDWRVYWTYVSVDKIGKPGFPASARELSGLRFDPVNDKLQVDIAWMSLDAIP